MFCSLPGAPIRNSSKLWPSDANITDPIRCEAAASYIRSDIGDSLMPWHLVAILFLVHLPLVIVRVACWEKRQIMSLVVAFFDAMVTIQAYVSTQLDPTKVMVWTPILLVIDVGAILQVVILVVRESGERIPIVKYFLHNRGNHQSENDWGKFHIVMVSLILFLGIIALQILGFFFACLALSNTNLTVTWCSPVFDSFAFAVQDSRCNLYVIEQKPNAGIACIKLPATQQHMWSIITAIVIALSIIFQCIDFCRLRGVKALVHNKHERPWFTMIFGLVAILAVMVFSILQAYTLPPGMTKDVLVANQADKEFLCRGALNPPGLRGSNIGWWDGLMHGWGCAWYGCV
ncbi:hypothetical protein K440DRAFT_663820 [Wilcoxina mikolae CBS 423.85]|nr:hypothetical protein K440DRAFT_663820 [Wilcoxina mikolae CBS 423.85]